MSKADRSIRRVHYNPTSGKVSIDYVTVENDGIDTVSHSLVSTDEPRAAFARALSALRADVAKIVEVDPEWVTDVRGVRLHESEEGAVTVTYTATHKTAESNSPIVVNTPAVAPVNQKRLDALTKAALEYVAGDRAQQELVPN